MHVPVPAAAKKELDTYAGRIMHEVEHSNSGTRDESWSDPTSGSRRQIERDNLGRITMEFATTTRGRIERTASVFYDGRTWISDQHRLPFQPRPVVNEAAGLAQSYRDKVANGTATLVGRQVINGREALHVHENLRFPPTPAPKLFGLPSGVRPPVAPPLRIDTWVDPFTYLPLRTRTGSGTHWSQTDTTWLPRAPANIAKTKLMVPAGFKHIVPNQGSGMAFSSGSVTPRSTRCQS